MTEKNRPDTLYRAPRDEISPFVFDEQVAEVFPDMIQRSVPGYHATLSVISTVTAEYAQPHSRLYDLGCSLGAATLAMRRAVRSDDCEIIAVDNSAAMVQRCRNLMAREGGAVPVRVLEQDILETAIENAAVVILNYTLQFIPAAQRADLLSRIHAGLLPGGVLLLSEKIVLEDEQENATMNVLHRRFKRLNGYDDLEIAQKRAALENVLVPEALAVHRDRLKSAGFDPVVQCLQFLNFITLMAGKPG